jgi:hypothetical protein
MVHRWITLTCSSAGDEGSWSKLLLPELLPLFLNMLVMIPPPLLWNLRPAVQNQVTLGHLHNNCQTLVGPHSEYCSWVCPKTSNWMKLKLFYELWWWHHIKTSSSVWPQSERNSHHEEHKKTECKHNEKIRIVAGKKKKSSIHSSLRLRILKRVSFKRKKTYKKNPEYRLCLTGTNLSIPSCRTAPIQDTLMSQVVGMANSPKKQKKQEDLSPATTWPTRITKTAAWDTQ